jgi:hypothetical protein
MSLYDLKEVISVELSTVLMISDLISVRVTEDWGFLGAPGVTLTNGEDGEIGMDEGESEKDEVEGANDIIIRGLTFFALLFFLIDSFFKYEPSCFTRGEISLS